MPDSRRDPGLDELCDSGWVPSPMDRLSGVDAGTVRDGINFVLRSIQLFMLSGSFRSI